MNTEATTKSQVRSDFKYAREMMRQADAVMRSSSKNFEDMESIANELIAAASTFAQWVEEQKESAAQEREEKETPNPYAVQIPQGAWNQDEWNAYTR